MPPTRSNSDSWSARRSFTCISTGTSPISSRKSVPPSASSKPPGLRADRAGEGAPLVPEQLALDEVLRDGRAVHLDERLVAPRRAPVERLRDELLAGAALAGDEDRRGGVRHLPDDVVDGLHRRRLAHERRTFPVREVRVDVLALEVVGARRLGDDLLQLLLLEGLRDVVERPRLERRDRAVHRAVGGDDDDRDVGELGGDPPQQLHPAELRHHEVRHDHVHRRLLQDAERLLAVCGGGDLVPLALQHRGEDAPDVHLVVDDEDVGHGGSFNTNGGGCAARNQACCFFRLRRRRSRASARSRRRSRARAFSSSLERRPRGLRRPLLAQARQRDQQLRPRAGRGADDDRPEVRLHDALADGEAEPGPLLLRRVEGDEDVLARLLRDARGRCRGSGSRRRRRAATPRARRRARRARPGSRRGAARRRASPGTRSARGSGRPASAARRRPARAAATRRARARTATSCGRLRLEQLERLLEHLVHARSARATA